MTRGPFTESMAGVLGAQNDRAESVDRFVIGDAAEVIDRFTEREFHLSRVRHRVRRHGTGGGRDGGGRMRWATRAGIHVDRAACAWLLRRFVDPAAEFVFVVSVLVLPIELLLSESLS